MTSQPTNNNLRVVRTDDDRRMHPYCLDCKLKCEEAGKDWKTVTKKCHGVFDDLDFEQIAEDNDLTVQEVKELIDPAEWIYQNLGMVPYWYQHRTLKCTSIRRALRWGRRTGKTETIAAYILYVVYTNAKKKVLCATPAKAQGKEINDRIRKFIDDNPKLKADVVRDVQQPYYEMVFANESRIRFFVAGSSGGANAGSQVRGQEADLIFIDEMDYLDDAATTAILPILSDPSRDGNPVEFIASTTPTGRESVFFKICQSDNYKEFHFPSWCRPDWDDEKEAEARQSSKTQAGYDHEYLAEWGTKSDGVFRRSDVLQAQEKYRYFNDPGFDVTVDWPEMRPYPSHWKYIMGVDWNGPGNGTRIVVVGFDPTRRKFILVYRHAVSVEEFSLSFAVEKMVEINRMWRCQSAYIDAGFGQMQDETLRAIGRSAKIDQSNGQEFIAADLMWESDLHAVDFGGWITYDTTEEGKTVERKVPIKNYMVENFQRFFEQKDFWFSRSDEELKQQFLGFHTPRQSAKGFPIYAADNEAGDHDLDACMLALFGFNQEMGGLMRKKSHIMDWAFVPYEHMNQPSLPDPITHPLDFERIKEEAEEEKRNKPGKQPIPARDIVKPNVQKYHVGQQLITVRAGGAQPLRSGGKGSVPKSRTAFLKRGRNGRR
jgi:hypothetical protein